MLLLCSDGLTNTKLLSVISKRIQFGTAALVVTADNEYKANNYYVSRCIQELQSLNLSVDIFDLDEQAVSELLAYDVVEFIGGNPYYLLNVLNLQNAKGVLKKLADNRIFIAWSAGAVVMGPTIKIVDTFTPEMNTWNIEDLTGMCLTDIQVIPHYSKFKSKFEKFVERCEKYQQDNNCKLVPLNDGEGILLELDRIEFIKV